jgi:hypothetical protein
MSVKRRRSHNPNTADVVVDDNGTPRNLTFTTIRHEDITDLLDVYDMDGNVQAAANIMLDSLLNGGVEFRRKSKHLDERAKLWYSRVWTKWIREVYRSIMAIGWVACSWVPHSEYMGEPVVLSLDHLDADMAQTYLGKTYFRLFERMQNVGPLDIIYRKFKSAQVEVPNVRVFILDAPNRDGTLRSRISVLRPDIAHGDELARLTLEAERNRARPLMVTEFQQEHTSSSVVNAPPITSGALYGNGSGPIDDSFEHLTNDLNAGANRTMKTYLPNQVYLEPNRKLVQHKSADVPAEFLAFRIARMERVFMIFGIPLSMISNVGSKGGRKDTGTGQNSNAQMLFLNAQKDLRQTLLSFAKVLYMDIYNDALIREHAAEHPDDDRLDPKTLASEIDVTISMPSLPDDDVLYDMYMKGLIQNSAMIECLSARHGLPHSAFNAKPNISVKELNGIKPETGKAS